MLLLVYAQRIFSPLQVPGFRVMGVGYLVVSYAYEFAHATRKYALFILLVLTVTIVLPPLVVR